MKCQKYIARCYHVYQHERNENASFLSIFKGGGRPKWRFSNFPRFWKNSSALGSFNCIFENNSLKALFGQNMKKVKILKLSPDSRYLQKLTLNKNDVITLYLPRHRNTCKFQSGRKLYPRHYTFVWVFRKEVVPGTSTRHWALEVFSQSLALFSVCLWIKLFCGVTTAVLGCWYLVR